MISKPGINVVEEVTMKSFNLLVLMVTVFLIACAPQEVPSDPPPVIGQLKVGFDIDDTILFSRDNFLKAPHMSDDPDHVDFGWVNMHDSLYSVVIQPTADLIGFLHAGGHEVYFITARPGTNGEAVGRFLSLKLGFPVVLGENLFFSAKKKDPVSGHRFTTKHELISKLGLHIFYGDSDTDMIAASIAGVRGVRVVRDARSVEAYSKNYFGDTRSAPAPKAPYSEKTYQQFLSSGVGPYGETIYPIYFAEPAVSD
jgi:acid phosphatase class B